MRVRKDRLVTHHAGKTEISEFDRIVSVEEYVSRLQVSVQDFGFVLASMALKQRTRQLCKEAPDLLLWEVGTFRRQLLLAFADLLGEVPSGTVLHHDIQLGGILVNDAIVVAHDVRVPQVSEDVDLSNQHLLFFFLHLSVV